MKQYLIDTNVLISFITNRNPAQQKVVTPFFEKASKNQNKILIHSLVVSEFVYVTQKIYRLTDHQVKNLLILLFQSHGIEFVENFYFLSLFSIWPQHISDYGDAVVASFAQNTLNCEILTFDKKFHKAANQLNISTHLFTN